ncbi:MAG: hypothetical protein JW919_00865 [Candidatus Omnitrophica bacterium]|nr:hypothetical protein [Candidatus Omnitrophota bacterium]
MIRRATRGDAGNIADLHALALRGSIFLELGRPFLEQFYYGTLADADDVFSYVYEQDGRIVGFVTMAASHELFYRHIMKDLPQLLVSLARSAIASPSSVASMAKAAFFMTKKERLIRCDAKGELLQIAVHPDYRARLENGEPTPFFRDTGVKVAEALFFNAAMELRKRGVRDFRIMTGGENVVSNKFYSRLGCRKVADNIQVFGKPTSLYRCDVEDAIGLLDHTGI